MYIATVQTEYDILNFPILGRDTQKMMSQVWEQNAASGFCFSWLKFFFTVL